MLWATPFLVFVGAGVAECDSVVPAVVQERELREALPRLPAVGEGRLYVGLGSRDPCQSVVKELRRTRDIRPVSELLAGLPRSASSDLGQAVGRGACLLSIERVRPYGHYDLELWVVAYCRAESLGGPALGLYARGCRSAWTHVSGKWEKLPTGSDCFITRLETPPPDKREGGTRTAS